MITVCIIMSIINVGCWFLFLKLIVEGKDEGVYILPKSEDAGERKRRIIRENIENYGTDISQKEVM